jgi:DNA-binding CsgD family transcriptional regulator
VRRVTSREGASGPRPATAVELKAQIELEREGLPFLAFRDGDGERHLVKLEPGSELWVGRNEAATLSLGWDQEVSGLHAQIEILGGECTVVDDGLSTNGSFVNGERVSGRRRLRDADVLRFGRTEVLFRSPAAAGDASTVIASDVLTAAGVSPAQKRVLTALCRPYKDGGAFSTPATNQQVAAELHLSIDAVKTHLRALFEKFDLGELPQNQKRVALVERALQTGLISERDL